MVVGRHSFKLRFELELGECEDCFVFFLLLLGLMSGLLMMLSLDFVRVNAVGEDSVYSFSSLCGLTELSTIAKQEPIVLVV